MKQKTIFDKNYNEIEYHEIDENGKTLYSRYTYYHGIKGNPHVVCRIEDSNGWIRKYDKNGKLTLERNSPNYNMVWHELHEIQMRYNNAVDNERELVAALTKDFIDTINANMTEIQRNLTQLGINENLNDMFDLR